MNTAHLTRAVAFFAAAAIFIGLAFSDGPSQRWERYVAAGYEAGVLGKLDARHETWLLETLQQVVPVTKTKLSISQTLPDGFALNQIPERSRLDIITFNATASQVPGLEDLVPGNALYVKPIDAIFLDTDMVRHAYGEDAGAELAGELRFLFLFTLLHEIGHRDLHGITTGLHSVQKRPKGISDKIAARMEQEADEEALRTAQLVLDQKDNSDAISFLFSDMTSSFSQDLLQEDSETIIPTLLSSVEILTRWLSMGGGRYSSFSFDAAHPNLIDRLDGMIASLDNALISDPKQNVLVPYMRKTLHLLRDMDGIIACEILLTNGVYDARWGEHGLEFLSGKGNLVRLPRDTLDGRSRRRTYCRLTDEEGQQIERFATEDTVEKFHFGLGGTLYNWDSTGALRFRRGGDWSKTAAKTYNQEADRASVIDHSNEGEPQRLILGKDGPVAVDESILRSAYCQVFEECDRELIFANALGDSLYYFAIAHDGGPHEYAHILAITISGKNSEARFVGEQLLPGEFARREVEIRIGNDESGEPQAYFFVSGVSEDGDYFAVHSAHLTKTSGPIEQILFDRPLVGLLPVERASPSTQMWMDPYISDVVFDPETAVAVLQLGGTELPILCDLHSGAYRRLAFAPTRLLVSPDRSLAYALFSDESSSVRSWIFELDRL